MKQSKADVGILKTILLWGTVGAITAVLFSMLCALLILKEILPENSMMILAAAVNYVSVFLVALISASKQGGRKLLTAMGTASVYFVLTQLAKLMFFPGEPVYLLQNGIISFVSAAVAAIVLSLEKGKGRHKRPNGR